MTEQLNSGASVAGFIDRFKTGALLVDEGCEDSEIDVQKKGFAMVKKSLADLDALGPHGRDALMPLMDDQAEAIQVYAAAALVRVCPERAVAVMRHIYKFSLSHVTHMTAFWLLHFYDKGELDL